MADIRVYPFYSPRIVEVLSPGTEISLQELHNKVRDWEDSDEGMSFKYLIDSAGKEPLGGGVYVGITSTLQNAYVMFTGRTTPLETGTCTTGDPDGVTLYATGGQFEVNNVIVGDTVMNYTTKALANVINVVSDTELQTLQLSGGSRATWLSSDEYIIWRNQQCNVSGGNLVAINSVGGEMSPVLSSPNVQVVRTASSSATLQELDLIQFASFGNKVTIDIASGVAGTAFPIGNMENPVDNWTDALAIANERGFHDVHIHGDYTFGATDVLDDMIISGDSSRVSTFTLTPGVSTVDTEFNEASIVGSLNGGVCLTNCKLGESVDLEGLEGCADFCQIAGTIKLGGAVTLSFCVSDVPGMGTPVIDFVGANTTLSMRTYSGGIELRNMADATNTTTVEFVAGQCILHSSCTNDATASIRGIFNLINNSTLVPDLESQAAKQTTLLDVPSDVWDEILTGATHNIPTSAGRRLRSLIDSSLIREETCRNGSTSSNVILDTGASGTNNFYDHMWIYITSGTGVGQVRTMHNYVGSTYTSEIVPDWLTTPDDTSKYSIIAFGSTHVHEIETEALDAITGGVWDVVRSGHTGAGTFGATSEWASAIDALAIQSAVWDADKALYNTADTMGELQNTGGSGGGLDADAVASAVWDAIANQYGTPGTMGWLQNLIQAGLISSPRIIPGD
jgi:hypothetical protein